MSSSAGQGCWPTSLDQEGRPGSMNQSSASVDGPPGTSASAGRSCAVTSLDQGRPDSGRWSGVVPLDGPADVSLSDGRSCSPVLLGEAAGSSDSANWSARGDQPVDGESALGGVVHDAEAAPAVAGSASANRGSALVPANPTSLTASESAAEERVGVGSAAPGGGAGSLDSAGPAVQLVAGTPAWDGQRSGREDSRRPCTRR